MKTRKEMPPKYILDKIDRLERLLDTAYWLKVSIEKWADEHGLDIVSPEWEDKVLDLSEGVDPICKENFIRYWRRAR